MKYTEAYFRHVLQRWTGNRVAWNWQTGVEISCWMLTVSTSLSWWRVRGFNRHITTPLAQHALRKVKLTMGCEPAHPSTKILICVHVHSLWKMLGYRRQLETHSLIVCSQSQTPFQACQGWSKFPNVCTKQPLGRSAFCKEHHAVALSKNVPTEFQKFVQQYEITGTHVLSTRFVVGRKHSTFDHCS